MNGYVLTHVYKIDGKLFVADSIEKVIELVKIYAKDEYHEIKSLKLIDGDQFNDSNVVMKKEPSFSEMCWWIRQWIDVYFTAKDGYNVDKFIEDLEQCMYNKKGLE